MLFFFFTAEEIQLRLSVQTLVAKARIKLVLLTDRLYMLLQYAVFNTVYMQNMFRSFQLSSIDFLKLNNHFFLSHSLKIEMSN